MIRQGSVRSTTKNAGTIYELTLKLKTARIILINNINNLRGNQLPAALKIKQVYKSLNKCGGNKQAPERRLVIMLCMSGLLNFHSHNIVGLAVTEDVELTVEEEFEVVSIGCSYCFHRCAYVSVT